MAAGAARIRVTFQVDADGLLSVSAQELISGVHAAITVKPSYGLADDQIASMLQDGFASAEGDMAARKPARGAGRGRAHGAGHAQRWPPMAICCLPTNATGWSCSSALAAMTDDAERIEAATKAPPKPPKVLPPSA